MEVCDRVSKKLLVKLELASTRELSHAIDARAASPSPHPSHTPRALLSTTRSGRQAAATPPNHAQRESEEHKGGADATCRSELVQAVLNLREWTEKRGWFELESRLLKAGTTDYRAYGEMERQMFPVPGRTGIYALGGRRVQVGAWCLLSSWCILNLFLLRTLSPGSLDRRARATHVAMPIAKAHECHAPWQLDP